MRNSSIFLHKALNGRSQVIVFNFDDKHRVSIVLSSSKNYITFDLVRVNIA